MTFTGFILDFNIRIFSCNDAAQVLESISSKICIIIFYKYSNLCFIIAHIRRDIRQASADESRCERVIVMTNTSSR